MIDPGFFKGRRQVVFIAVIVVLSLLYLHSQTPIPPFPVAPPSNLNDSILLSETYKDLPDDFEGVPEGFKGLPEGFKGDLPAGFTGGLPEGFNGGLPEGFKPLPDGVEDLPEGFQGVPEGFKGLPGGLPPPANGAPLPGLGFGAIKAHPIDDLLREAKLAESNMLLQQTQGLAAAARAYRKRRGRHPPPRFDRWYKWAMEHDVIMIEGLFDTMYDDLEPFWGVAASMIRDFPISWSDTLSIRNGSVIHWKNERHDFTLWMDRYGSAFEMLPLDDIPDVNIALNAQDEPKMFVPWEIKNKHLTEALANKKANPPTGKPKITEFETQAPLPENRPPPEQRSHFKFMDYPHERSIWGACHVTCPPDSKARTEGSADIGNYSIRPEWPTNLPHMHEGFVSNWSSAKSACDNPHLRGLHGSFIAMQAQHVDNEAQNQKALIGTLVPLLSGSKIRDINSEILIPAAMHWPDKFAKAQGSLGFNFGTQDTPGGWQAKKDVFMWKGSASGGVNNEENWVRFQRHRFVAMMNASLVSQHQKAMVEGHELPAVVPAGDPPLPYNFPMPNDDVYDMPVLLEPDPVTALRAWLTPLTDAAFTHLRCFPPMTWFGGDGADCPYNKAFYAPSPEVKSSELLRYKYLPDIDGATFSGRWRAFLLSDSLAIKATIYDEWHDSRLIPWRHFIPMDNTFSDFWGLLQYIVGYKDKVAGHDDVAKQIALDGRDWSRKVLREEDMVAYIYRLVLELARLQDERRQDMGFAGDL